VLGTVEDDVLIDLVAHDQKVMLHGDGRHSLHLELGEHPSGRVVRRVEHDQAGPWRQCGTELVRVQREVRRAQRHRDPHPTRHGDGCGVGVVGGVQRDHLVAGVHQCEHGCRDRLGRARGDQHLGVRVQLDPIAGALMRSHGAAQLRDSLDGWVLVAPALQDRARGSLCDVARTVGVGEALAQVDRRGRSRTRGHFREDRRAEISEMRRK
jgi:hypothetical protein